MFDGLAGRQYHIQKWDESYQLLEYSGNQEYWPAIYTTERSRFIEWDSRFHIPFGQWLVFWDQYVTMALWLCNERHTFKFKFRVFLSWHASAFWAKDETVQFSAIPAWLQDVALAAAAAASLKSEVVTTSWTESFLRNVHIEFVTG